MIKVFASIVGCASVLLGLICAPLLLKLFILLTLLMTGRYAASLSHRRKLIS
jgi:hypothetical protein